MEHCPDAFFIPFDGLLYQSDTFHFIAWEALAAELGIHFGEEEFLAIKGMGRLEALNKVLANGGKKFIFTDQEKLELLKRQANYVEKILPSVQPYDYSSSFLDFIHTCKEKGISLVLSANANQTIPILKTAGLADAFDWTIDLEQTSKGKQMTELYKEASHRLDISLQRSVGIHDSISGIRSYKKTGMIAVGIGNEERLLHAGAHLVYPSIELLHVEQCTSSLKNFLAQ